MSKRFFLIILGCLISSWVLAQPFFFGGTSSSNGSTPSRMSPSDLDRKIAESAAQNQAALQENLNQRLAKVPPPTIVKVTPGSSGSTATSTPSTASNPFAPSAPITTPSPPTYSAPVAPRTPQQVYTGFGGSTNTNTNVNKPQSSQWNIKY